MKRLAHVAVFVPLLLTVTARNKDYGDSFIMPKQVRIKVVIEREYYGDVNRKMVVYAVDFRQEYIDSTYKFIFSCPCFLGDDVPPELIPSSLTSEFSGESLVLRSVGNADYNVKVEELLSTSEK